MKLGFSKEKKMLCLVIHPSEISDMINFLEALKNDDARENYLISEVSQKISAHTDPDENLLVNIFGEYIDFSIRLMDVWVTAQKQQGLNYTETEKLLCSMRLANTTVS